jgi:hypothetical protein
LRELQPSFLKLSALLVNLLQIADNNFNIQLVQGFI